MIGGKNNDPQLELQKYLIENILAVLNVKIEDLFEKKNVEIDIDSNKYQAIILTLVRILLTQNMKDYNTFKQKLRITNTDNICDSLTTALNALSYRFVRWNTYSYNTILSNFQYAGACDDFDKIITVNLNKLYDMLVTKGSLYINEMKQKAIQKAKGSTDYKVTQNIIEKYNKYGYYNETYDANNPNYIFK
jgi:Glu-tRNA(Gln) amidotransferase subunit E-like FAD-binding protein